MKIPQKLASFSWSAVFSNISIFAVRFILIGLFLFLAVVVYRGLKQEGYTVQPFQVAKDLENAGYNGQVIAMLLQDQVKELKILANSQREDSLDFNVQTNPDLNLEVMGVGLSASSVIYYIRDLVGQTTNTIGGNITDLDHMLTLTLRMTGFPPYKVEKTYDDGTRQTVIQTLIDDAAIQLLRVTDPYRLALVMRHRGDSKTAEEIIREIIINRPSDRKWAYHFWANLKSEAGDRSKAKEYYRQAIEEDPNFSLPRRMLAWQLYEEELYDEAIEQFERALAINPLESSMHQGAALCYTKIGNLNKANYHYEQQINKHPDVIWNYGNYSNFLYTYQKDPEKAAKVWERASQNIDKSGDYYAALGAFELLRGDSIKAMQYAMSALDLDPNNVLVLTEIAQLHYNREDFAAAETYYRQLTHQLNDNYDRYMRMSAYNYLAIAEYQQEKFDSAIVHANLAITALPKNPYPWSTLAEAYLLKGDKALFYSYIEKAVQLGFNVDRYLDTHPYNRVKDEPRMNRLINQSKELVAIKD